jgi:hypothetical protein
MDDGINGGFYPQYHCQSADNCSLNINSTQRRKGRKEDNALVAVSLLNLFFAIFAVNKNSVIDSSKYICLLIPEKYDHTQHFLASDSTFSVYIFACQCDDTDCTGI